MLTADERKRLFHLHDGDRYITEAGSEDDRWLHDLEEQGIVRLYDAVSRELLTRVSGWLEHGLSGKAGADRLERGQAVQRGCRNH